MYKGTQGWHTCEAISKRRIGVRGSGSGNGNGGATEEGVGDSPYYVAVKLRTAGDHEGHRSFWEWDNHHGSWMLLVLDAQRNIVGQVMGRTQAACHRKMNAVYEAKGLGVYNSQYLD